MDITTRISTKAATDTVGHHIECSRDHAINIVRFMSCSPDRGFASTMATDCMFFEMEDAAYDSIVEAYGGYDYDDEAVRTIAADMASHADSMITGTKTHVRNKVVAA